MGNGNIVIGDAAAPGPLHKAAGNLTLTASDLVLGAEASGSGTYELDGGSLSILSSVHKETIGGLGEGTFIQTGGSNTVGAAGKVSLIIGSGADAFGQYALLGTGTLSVLGEEYLGIAGAAEFDQTGGTHTIGNGLVIGEASADDVDIDDADNAADTYNLSAGNLSAQSEIIGYATWGSFAQPAAPTPSEMAASM